MKEREREKGRERIAWIVLLPELIFVVTSHIHVHVWWWIICTRGWFTSSFTLTWDFMQLNLFLKQFFGNHFAWDDGEGTHDKIFDRLLRAAVILYCRGISMCLRCSKFPPYTDKESSKGNKNRDLRVNSIAPVNKKRSVSRERKGKNQCHW